MNLILYERAKQALAQCLKVDEVKNIRDQAIALAAYAMQAKDAELIANATELRLRAERRIGQLMQDQREAGLLRVGNPNWSVADPLSKPITLEQLGVGKRLADKARKICALPPQDFEDYVAESRGVYDKSVESILNRFTKESRRDAMLQALAGKARALPTESFVVAVLDPAWRQEPWSRKTGLNKAPDNHYPTQTPEEVAALKPPLTRDGLVYMWTTTSMMRIAIEILEGWGLAYRSNMVWVKQRPGRQMGTGHWSRVDHEIVLIYAQGSPPEPAEKISSVLFSPVGKHSEKPDEFYAMIKRNYPDPVPLLEMYARKPRPGWTVWGNEVES